MQSERHLFNGSSVTNFARVYYMYPCSCRMQSVDTIVVATSGPGIGGEVKLYFDPFRRETRAVALSPAGG